MSRVFISSTFSDLRDHRKSVATALRKAGHDVVEMEGFAAQDERPLDYCLSKVAEAEMFVCILAWRFGFVAKGHHSITELEYERATQDRKRRFCFLLDPNHPWLPALCDEGTRPHRPIDRLRDRLSSELVCDFFTTPEDLAARVVAALAHAERKRLAAPVRIAATTALTRTSDGTPVDLLPGTLAAATLGRIQYWRASERRQTLHRQLFRENALETTLFPDMKVLYRSRGGEEQRADKLVTIVTGAAGVGKTSYTSRLVAKLDSAIDVPIVLRGTKLAEFGALDPLNVCREIRAYFADPVALERDTRIPFSAVSHALNNRRTLIVIEDLHHAGPAHEVLKCVRAYLEQYHYWGPRLRIVATTREPAGQIKLHIGDEAALVSLQPFAPRDAQRFFFDLAVQNGVDLEKLTPHGDALSRAFATEGVRTPLFVVICAWLTSQEEGAADIESVLRMTASEVFDTFIQHLFQRSGAPKGEYREFRDFYERLALSHWPQWEDCRLEIVEEQCRALGTGIATATVEFMQQNGYLIASRFHGLRLQFPHQSMADYLTACALVKHQRWSDLARETIVGRVEGLVPFLIELIRDEEALLDLAKANFGLFLDVLDGRVVRGDALPVRRIVAALADHARASVRYPPLPESFTRVRRLVEGRLVDAWIRDFITVLETVHTSSEVIETLAQIGSEGSALLEKMLNRPDAHQAFLPVADRPSVQAALARPLSNLSHSSWRTAAHILLACNAPAGVKLVRRSLVDHVPHLRLEDLRALRQTAIGTRVLADVLSGQPLTVKQEIAALCVKLNGRALVPRGVYDIQVEGTARRVKVNQSFVVPAVAQTVHGTFNTVASIAHAVERQLGGQALMTEFQARVVCAHFGFSSGRDGVLFAAPGEDTPEVFRTNAGFGLFVIPSNTTALQSFANSTPNRGTRQIVRCRAIEPIEHEETS